MKKLSTGLFLIILFNVVQAQKPQVIYKADWGTRAEQAGLRTAFDGRYGPQAFHIKGDSVLILDEQNRKLKTFYNGSLQQSLKISPVSRDFLLTNKQHLTLLTDAQIQYFENGKQIASAGIEAGKVVQAIQKIPSAAAILRFSNGENETLNPATSLQKSGDFVNVYKRSASLAEIVVNVSAKQASFFIDFPDRNLADLQFIGMDEQNHLFIHIDLFLQQVPLKVKRQVRVFELDGTHLLTYGIPLNDYALIFRDLEVTDDGSLFQMIQLPEELKILKWSWPGSVKKLPLEIEAPEYDWNREEHPGQTHSPAVRATLRLWRRRTKSDGRRTRLHAWRPRMVGNTRRTTLPEATPRRPGVRQEGRQVADEGGG